MCRRRDWGGTDEGDQGLAGLVWSN